VLSAIGVFGGLVALGVVICLIRDGIRLLRGAIPLRAFAITIDDEMIVVAAKGRELSSVRWDALTRVCVVVASEGLFVECAYWVLESPSGGCSYPTDAKGADELRHAMKRRLSGFNEVAYGWGLLQSGGHGVVVWPPNSSAVAVEDESTANS
jgi:hypothetical protein